MQCLFNWQPVSDKKIIYFSRCSADWSNIQTSQQKERMAAARNGNENTGPSNVKNITENQLFWYHGLISCPTIKQLVLPAYRLQSHIKQGQR